MRQFSTVLPRLSNVRTAILPRVQTDVPLLVHVRDTARIQHVVLVVYDLKGRVVVELVGVVDGIVHDRMAEPLQMYPNLVRAASYGCA